ncbi:MAG: heme-copper oxidase subunit III [bacterium]
MATRMTTPEINDGHSSGLESDGLKGAADPGFASVQQAPVNKGVLGLLMFIGAEVMFFGGLISVFLILRANSQTWPPAGQPMLPLVVTLVNTVFLLASGFTMNRAMRASRADLSMTMTKWLIATAGLGATFLLIQGSEWVRLIRFGLTLTSSTYGGIFYALIGCHGLHVAGAMVFLLIVLKKSLARTYSTRSDTLAELCGLYWYFVVAIWPVLFVLVYLS